MRRVLTSLAVAAIPLVASAQEQDSIFSNMEAYEAFVTEKVMTRDWIPLIQRLGARDEYTIEQLNGINRQFNGIFEQPFTETSRLDPVDLGGGFSKEVRAFWGPSGYAWYGALLHERDDAVIVINFRLNSDVQPVMAQYGQ